VKVTKITLHNFRQFYGTQHLEISTDIARNVTLIHAENGVGKTTLLNALLWALYETPTSRFEQKDKITSFAAMEERKKKAQVKVNFEFQGNEYEIVRDGEQGPKGFASSVHAYSIQRGVRKTIEGYEAFVGQVLPKHMAPYFFFDGEHAESFASAANTDKVRDALTSMLGCEIVDEAMRELIGLKGEANKALKEMGETDADKTLDELSDLEDEIRGFRSAIERDEALKKTLNSEIRELEEELRALEDQLTDHKLASNLNKERKANTHRRAQLEAEIRDIQTESAQWVAQYAVPLFGRRLQQTSLAFIDEESLKGRIPSPYNEQFVKDLIESKLCICKRPLEAHSEALAAIMSMLPKAANRKALDRLVEVRTFLGDMQKQASEAPSKLTRLQEREVSKRETLRREEVAFSEIEARLKAIDEEALRIAVNRRNQIEETRKAKNQRIGEHERNIKFSRAEIQHLEGQVAEREKNRVKSTFPKQFRELVVRAASKLQDAKAEYVDEARAWIAERINDTLERTTRRAYRFTFGDKLTPKDPDGLSFSLRYASTGEVVPRSGGENQLTTLFFTAALAAFAKHRMNDPNPLLVPGTEVPLVLDSPFGQLDVAYRRSVAQELPEMARQVVLLLSSSQSSPEVLDALGDRIGRRYYLKLHNRELTPTRTGLKAGRGKDMPGHGLVESLNVGGKVYPLINYGAERSWTEIVEIKE
jgi:DNA sulfur modification protein DndD